MMKIRYRAYDREFTEEIPAATTIGALHARLNDICNTYIITGIEAMDTIEAESENTNSRDTAIPQ